MNSTPTLDLPGLSIPAQGSQATTVRLLSLWQPWASLVATKAKQIETRSWQTPYRGKIAIHAASALTREIRELCASEPFCGYWLRALRQNEGGQYHARDVLDGLPRGCIVATCDLLDCLPISGKQMPHYGPFLGTDGHGGYKVWTVPPPEPERSFGDYTPGRWAWILENIQPLAEPLPWKGAQGLRAIQWPENNQVLVQDTKMRTEIEAFYGGDEEWGVQERYVNRFPGCTPTATIYDAMFTEAVAKRVAALLRRKRPPKDWMATHAILRSEGFEDADLFPKREHNQAVRTGTAKED